jgi:hypothetical protein
MWPMTGILSRMRTWLAAQRQTYLAAKTRKKFPNIPDKLMIFVRDHMSEYKKTGDRNVLYLEAAGGVIRQYLNLPVFANENDPYLESRIVNNQEAIWYIFMIRVMLLGETLFLLRSCDGFAEMCRRLKEQHDLRSAFYEMRAARRFHEAGYGIHVRPETQVFGEDFDFTASRDGVYINVEATALKEKEFNETTAINALRRKTKQLGIDRPGVIFCLIPSSWENIGMNMNEWAQSLAEKFLRGTRRINVLVLQVERRIDISPDQSKGMMFTISKSFFNEEPRHSADLSFLFEDGIPPEEQAAITNADTPIALNELTKKLRKSEFYRWVDYLVP